VLFTRISCIFCQCPSRVGLCTVDVYLVLNSGSRVNTAPPLRINMGLCTFPFSQEKGHFSVPFSGTFGPQASSGCHFSLKKNSVVFWRQHHGAAVGNRTSPCSLLWCTTATSCRSAAVLGSKENFRWSCLRLNRFLRGVERINQVKSSQVNPKMYFFWNISQEGD
jgi:hypothetical protein